MLPPLREAIPGSGLLVFDCTPLRASLSPAACAGNFLHHRCLACQDCPIGAHHAGVDANPTRPQGSCIRCGELSGNRLIGRSWCVSCYNRQREVLNGCNAKGSFPVHTSASLRWLYAIVSASEWGRSHRPYIAGPGISNKAGLPSCDLIEPGFHFIKMIGSGREEFGRWLERLYPTATVIDFDQGPTIAELHGLEVVTPDYPT